MINNNDVRVDNANPLDMEKVMKDFSKITANNIYDNATGVMLLLVVEMRRHNSIMRYVYEELKSLHTSIDQMKVY